MVLLTAFYDGAGRRKFRENLSQRALISLAQGLLSTAKRLSVQPCPLGMAEKPMLSIVTSSLNAAQKDLSVTANNLANAGTTGFKRSEANFLDLYSNDPTADPRTLIGGGTQLGEIDRSTAQGPMKTTGNVTDLAISGRGFFTLARDDGSLIYTRAGNFTVDVNGLIVDSANNQLQGFTLGENGVALKSQPLTNLVVPAEN